MTVLKGRTEHLFKASAPRLGGTTGKGRWPRVIISAALFALPMGASTPDSASCQGVSVSPTALFLDQGERSTRMTLVNESARPVEVEISFAFGYAQSDSTGRVSVPLVDSAGPGEPSLIPYLRAFPQRLRLAPGQRGMVRILVQAPTSLEDGEYWARVMVASTGAQAPVEQRVGNANVRLNVKSVVAIAANYRHGLVATSLEVEKATARTNDRGVELLLDLSRGGNAAWLGRVDAQVLDPSGRVVGSSLSDVVCYRPLRWKVNIPLEEPLEGGPYSIRYALSAERPDEDPEDILKAPAVTGSVPVG